MSFIKILTGEPFATHSTNEFLAELADEVKDKAITRGEVPPGLSQDPNPVDVANTLSGNVVSRLTNDQLDPWHPDYRSPGLSPSPIGGVPTGLGYEPNIEVSPISTGASPPQPAATAAVTAAGADLVEHVPHEPLLLDADGEPPAVAAAASEAPLRAAAAAAAEPAAAAGELSFDQRLEQAADDPPAAAAAAAPLTVSPPAQPSSAPSAVPVADAAAPAELAATTAVVPAAAQKVGSSVQGLLTPAEAAERWAAMQAEQQGRVLQQVHKLCGRTAGAVQPYQAQYYQGQFKFRIAASGKKDKVAVSPELSQLAAGLGVPNLLLAVPGVEVTQTGGDSYRINLAAAAAAAAAASGVAEQAV